MRFDAATDGTDAADWDAAISTSEQLALRPAPRRVLIVSAHPDDETLGAGGLIARLGDEGARITIACVTDGGASADAASDHASAEARSDLVATRAAELRSARDVLAPRAEIVSLGFPDGGAREHRAAIGQALATLITRIDPDLVVAPWPGDGHRDHRIVGEVCEALAADRGIRMLAYPIWYWHWGRPEYGLGSMERLESLPLASSERARKVRAITSFRSQTAPENGAAVLRPSFLRHFDRDRELYVGATSGDGVARHFERMHRLDPDPWAVETSWYERRKAALVLATIPDEKIGSVLEIGASTGALTARLAERSASVLAVDVSPAAVERARDATAAFPHVRVERADVREGLPAGPFDLIVLSEVGYYLTVAEFSALCERMRHALTEAGSVLACHGSGRADDMPQSGEDVHRHLREVFTEMARHDEREFAIGSFGRGL